MDNRTFNELLNAGEVGLIMADGAQALSKKQLGTIIQRTQSSIGRNIPESFQSKVQSTTNLKPETRKENPFISPIGQTRNTRLRKGDSVAAILAKMFSFMKKTHEEKKLRRELIRDFEKENEDKKNRLEKKKSTKKPKSESKLKNFSKNLTQGLKNSFDKLFKFLAKLAIVAFIFEIEKGVDEVVKDAEKFVKKIEEVKKTIEEGIDKIKSWISNLTGWYRKLKDWLMSLEFFGWKPFGGTERPISTFPEGTTEYEKYKEITAVREGGPLGYDAMFGEFDKKNPPKYKGKMVSELTIGEAIEFGRSRGAKGALGRYGFIPSTLESNYRDAGLSKDDIFNPTNQDIIFKTLTDKNANDLTKRLGRDPTAAELRVAHAVGVGGSMQLYKAEKEDSQQTALDILLPQLDISKVGQKQYDKREQERKSNQHLNYPVKEVLDKMRKDFKEKNNPNLIKPENSLSDNESMLTSPVVKPSINSDKVSSLFKDNDSLKETMSIQLAVIDNSTTNNIIGSGQKTQIISAPTLPDYPNLPAFKA